jgi:hypothetical protein
METHIEQSEIAPLQKPTPGQVPEKQTRPLRGTSAFVLTVMATIGIVALLALLFRGRFNIESLLINAGWLQSAEIGGASPDGSNARELAGTKVSVFGAFFDEYGDLFTQSVVPFEEETGIDVDFRTGTEGYLMNN